MGTHEPEHELVDPYDIFVSETFEELSGVSGEQNQLTFLRGERKTIPVVEIDDPNFGLYDDERRLVDSLIELVSRGIRPDGPSLDMHLGSQGMARDPAKIFEDTHDS